MHWSAPAEKDPANRDLEQSQQDAASPLACAMALIMVLTPYTLYDS